MNIKRDISILIGEMSILRARTCTFPSSMMEGTNFTISKDRDAMPGEIAANIIRVLEE